MDYKKDEFGIAYASKDLSDEQIEVLANSNISNLAFCRSWTHPEETYEYPIYSYNVRIKVLKKRGYNKIKNIIKYLFRELTDPNDYCYDDIAEIFEFIPREEIVKLFRETCKYCLGPDILKLELDLHWYLYFAEKMRITKEEFNDDETWNKVYEYQKEYLTDDYGDYMLGKLE